MNSKHLNQVMMLLLIVAAFFPRLTAAQNGIVVDKIIAKIDNQIILKSDLEGAYQNYLEQGQPAGEGAKCQLLQQLIINKMLVAKAEIDTIQPDKAGIERELDRRMDYFVMQFGSIQKLEQTLGKTVSQLKDELRPQITEQMTIQKMQAELTKDVKITPRQVKKFFNAIPKDSIPFLPKEVEVGHIVKLPLVNKAEKERVKGELLDLKRRILSGESFEELAVKYSEDLGSKSQGGDLGWQGRGNLVPQFEATAMQLEPGQIADPVESEFGFHLIQLIERRGNQYHSRHILIRPQSDEAGLQAAEHYLDSIRTRIVTDSVGFEKAAREFSDDKETKIKDGYFSDPETGMARLATDQLEYGVFMTVDTMKVGTITRPIRFRMDEGGQAKTAVRILYFKSMIPPHFANLKDDYQKIYTVALAEEKNRVLQEWFEKTQTELFIDIDPEYDQCQILKSLNAMNR